MSSRRRDAVRRSSIVRAVYAVEQLEVRCLLTSVTSASFNLNVVPNELTLTFDRDVSAEVTANTFILENATLDQAKSSPTIAFDPAGTTATITYPLDTDSLSELPGTYADGFYRLAIGTDDIAGLTTAYTYDFSMLTGDVTHDGIVNAADYRIVDDAYIREVGGWDNGDFDYSGVVDSSDYNLMDYSFAVALQAPPSAPDQITVSYVPSEHALAANWNADAVTGEAGWRVQRSLDGHDFSQWHHDVVGDLTGIASFADTDSTLPDGTRVYYRVRAYGNGLDTAFTPKSSAYTRLNRPVDVSAAATGTHQVTVSWTDTSDHESGFVIEQVDGDEFVQVGTAAANATHAIIDDLDDGTDYQFRVRAVNANTTSGRGIPVPASLPIAAPNAVKIDASSIGGTIVSWSEDSNVETGFVIERKTGSAAYAQVGTVGANVKSFIDTSTALATDYTYRVRTAVGTARSDPSAGVSVHSLTRAYSNDFSGAATGTFAAGVSGGWGENANRLTLRGNDAVLGGFTNEDVELNLDGLGAHEYVSVDVHLIFWGSWLGNGVDDRTPSANVGNDRWRITANTLTLADTTIATDEHFQQSWPSPSLIANNPARTAEETTDGALQIPNDDGTYHMSFRFQDAGSHLKLDFSSVLHDFGVGTFGVSGVDVFTGGTTFGSLAREPELGTPTPYDSHTMRVNYSPGQTAAGYPFVYSIKRSTDQQNWTLVLQPSRFSQLYMDYQAEPDTTYYYRFASGGTLIGPAVHAKTPVSTKRPAPYLNTPTVVSSNRIDLRWQIYSAVDLQGFNIYRFSGGPTGPTEYPLDDAHRIGTAVQGLTYSDVGVAGGTTYHYFVTAAFPVGESAADGSNATTPGVALPAPTNLIATGVTTTAASLMWDDVDGAASYSLFRGGSEDFTPSESTRIAGPSNSTHFDDTGLSSGARYFYKVTAANAAGGQSGESNTVAIFTTDVAPGTPGELHVTETTTSRIRIAWDAVSNAADYSVQLATDGGPWNLVLSGVRQTEATLSQLTSDKPYSIRVRASNSVGDSSWSTEVPTRTLPISPARPVALETEPHYQIMGLRWTMPPSSSPVTGFRIERSTGNDQNFELIRDNLPASRRFYYDWHALKGQLYFYRVISLNNDTESEPVQASVTTMRDRPSAPDNLTTDVISWDDFAGPREDVLFSFDDTSNLEDGFTISAAWTYREYLQMADLHHTDTITVGKHTGVGQVQHKFTLPVKLQTAQQWTLAWTAKSFNESGDSDPLSAPVPPSDIKLSQQSDGGWDVEWKDNSDNETEFWIMQDGDVVAIVGRNTTHFSVPPSDGPVDNFTVWAANEAGREKAPHEQTDLPRLSISAVDGQASEPGHDPNDKGKFRITNVGEKSATAKLSVKGKAIEGTDYYALPKSVTVGANSSVDVDLVAKGDDLREPEEDVKYVLMGSQFYTGSGSATSTILDSDWIDLAIDSNNDSAFDVDPGNGGPDDSIEDSSTATGKMIRVDDGDTDGDGIPDFADGFAKFGSESNIAGSVEFTPVVLTLAAGIDRASARLKVVYDASDPKDVTRTGNGTDAPYIYKLPQMGGSIRLWTKPANSARSEASIVDGGDFIPTSNTEFLEGAALARIPWSGNTATLWVEGLKGAAGVITARLDPDGAGPQSFDLNDTVHSVGVKASLGINAGDAVVPGKHSPDVTWTIDTNDDLVKDQGNGFQFWWSRNGSDKPDKNALADLIPFKVDLSGLPSNVLATSHKFRLSLSDITGGLTAMQFMSAASPSSDRRRFLDDVNTADAQIGKYGTGISNMTGGTAQNGILHGSAYADFTFTGSQEFVIRGVGQGLGSARLSLSLVIGNGRTVPIDSVKFTFHPVDDFWAMWSTRGQLSDVYLHPGENGDSGKLQTFPEARYVAVPNEHPLPDVLSSVNTAPDPNRQVLVFVHGYNTSEKNARDSFNNTFQRLYWLGYRGAFVGFNWQGDDGRTPLLSPDVFLQPENWRAAFDPNVKNAFRTAYRFEQFLDGNVGYWTGGHPENVNLLAHSLGNLVMWEGLRLGELIQPAGKKLANNVISSEAAIWKEAFEPESPLTYPSAGYEVDHALDNITYSVDDQQRDSWRFWFRQVDNGQEHDIKRLLTGRTYNSFNPNDFALKGAMRLNDYVMRGLVGGGHYLRDGLDHLLHRKVTDDYPLDGLFSNDSMENMPALMSHREAIYGPNLLNLPLRHVLYNGVADINLPLGATDTHDGDYFGESINAAEAGWPDESHGAAFYDGDTDRDDHVYDTSLPAMWNWYSSVFSASNENHQHAGIRLGNG